ncbi:MAG: tRNA (adenosine(37)-N6)-threonylcarbamoyltransferase complex ATPase subunit type 1 TsaE, partial [Bacteroidetes bacterium]|nr:tRNA (adenosine(37)-N6)-threonylcarbamoyltransferase complex ATPase subunit type 1 TsaE [Bacteroidota bacterium]
CKIFLFIGEMGAGKTTLIKEFCWSLGVEEDVSSPTYALVNEYSSKQGTIYHFDLFRLKSTEEALDIGLENYIDSGNICLIEWPQHAFNLLDEAIKIEIEKIDTKRRKFRIFKF